MQIYQIQIQIFYILKSQLQIKIKNNDIIINKSQQKRIMLTNRSVKPNSSRRNSPLLTKSLKDVPRVEIFLDAHLNKAINRIKSQIKNKKQKKIYSSTSKQDQQPQEQRYKLLNSQRGQNFNIQNSFSQKITLLSNQTTLNYIKQVYYKYDIKNPFQGYLDFNQEKQSQYFAFEKYPSFSDKKQSNEAVQKNFEVKTHKKQKKISLNQIKILQLKNKFKQQIADHYEEQNTIKKNNKVLFDFSQKNIQNQAELMKYSQGNITYIDNLTGLMESRQLDSYDFENDTTIHNTCTMEESTPERSLQHINNFEEQKLNNSLKPRKKLFVKTKARAISTNYPTQNTTPSSKLFDFSQIKNFRKQQKKDTQNQTQELYLKYHQKLNKKSYKSNFINNGKNQIYSSQIPQVYRYCLGCQQAILTLNIEFHEQKCQQLKNILNLQVEEIQKYIEMKIQRLRKQILKSSLLQLNEKSINEIKQCTMEWLNYKKMEVQKRNLQQEKIELNKNIIKFKEKNCQLEKESGVFDEKILDQTKKNHYDNILRLIDRNLLDGCEKIKKLQWFIKMKQNIEYKLIQQKKENKKKQFDHIID